MNNEMSTSWHSYPKIFALGHRYLEGFLDGNVIVEEKIDGSQFSFGKFDGVLRARSKGKELIIDAPEKMFERAVEVIKTLDLKEGYTYRAEYLQKPHHNTLSYNRTPTQHLIIFDINDGHESYLEYNNKMLEARRLGLETVPLLHCGKIAFVDELKSFLERPSVLGGQLIEGFVIKNHLKFGQDGKAMMGKFVSEAFKEVHNKEWKKTNPNKGDVIAQIIEDYTSEARWNKAIQHLKEAGNLDSSPKDIGPLIREVGTDILAECEDEIKEKLFKWAWPNIQRGLTRGLPQWYKEKLLSQQFEGEADADPAA